MKKILFIFLFGWIFYSCNSDPNNSAQIIRSANDNMEIELVYNPPFERIYQFKFKGHRYIDFDGYRRTGVVHDPDCECFRKY